jgi:predicted dehydrogenase
MTAPVITSTFNRRQFLKISAAGVAALSAGPLLSRAVSGANERLSIGMIGAGGRANDLLGQLLELADKQNAQVTAICDVWQKNLHATAARVNQRFGQEPRLFTRFGELLALKDVDAVTIATPDFSHAPILVAALKAGKDVYIEKPMSINLALANEAVDLARSKERVVQVGTQYRSDSHYKGAAKVLASGALGQISRISVAVNFNEARWARDVSDCQEADVDWDAFLLKLPKRPFDARLLRRWQLYRACTNGISGLWMSHYADLTHMLTRAQYPGAAVALGGIYVWKDGREHTDTFHALLEYPEEFLLDWSMGLGNFAGNHFTIHGTKGTMDLLNWTISNAGSTDKQIETKPIPTEPGPSHMQNWLECIRSRQKPNADIQYGQQHAVATIMAAKALESGLRQKYNPSRRAIVAG